MLASLSPEAQVNRILDDIGSAPSNFSEIADRHANSRVIQALKGANDFDPADGQYYLNVARQMKQLADDYPVPISWKETQRIKQILAQRSEGPPAPFAVVLIEERPFKRMSAGQPETTSDYKDCAAFDDHDVAFVVAKVLRDLGHSPVRVTTITNERRAPETFTNTLAEVGFVQQQGFDHDFTDRQREGPR
jgi:hypothetical protein